MTNDLILILTGALVGAASGYLGSFMVLKRMSLVGDALSHVALPGIAIAILIGINPMLGAFVALAVAVIGIWYLEGKYESYPESLVGIFFTASLALGVILTPEPEIYEALFGNIDKVTFLDGVAIILGSILIFGSIYMVSKKMMLGIVSADLAKAEKINLKQVNLVYLLMVGLVVSLGIKFLGTLLTGALVIIPAVTAKNICGNIKQYQTYSIVLGLASTVFGILVARLLDLPTGATVVLVSIVFYIFSLLFKKENY